MDFLKEAPPVLRDFLVYMETIMGRSKNTVNAYYLDLRMFFRFLLQKRGLVDGKTPFDQIPLDQADLDLVRSVTRADILDFLVYTARERPKFYKSPETTYGNESRARSRKISALRSFILAMFTISRALT